MNKYPKKNMLRATFFASLVGFVAAGCANFSGEGNEFTITGRITDVDGQSVETEVTEVEIADGAANGWFEVGAEHRFHDNCDCHGFWRGNKRYGEVESYEGSEIELSDLRTGQCLEIEGRIRSDNEGKTNEDRPVFNIARQVGCE